MNDAAAALVLILALAATDRETVPATAPPTAAAVPADVVARADLATVTVESAPLTREVEAFGRVLDPLPLVDAVLGRGVATAALGAARTELTRVTALHQHGANASARDLEAAEVAVARARADAAAAEVKVRLAWGNAAAERSDLDHLTELLGTGRIAIARVDLPAGVRTPTAPLVARLRAVGDGRAVAARLLGSAPTADPTLQGDGFLLLLEDLPPPAGTALVATIGEPATASRAAAVPRAAIVWHEGTALIYVVTGPGAIERRTITPAATRGDAWLVSAGVTPGDRVVVRGAAQLLAAEVMRGAAPE